MDLKEKNEEGKPETTKKFKSVTPGETANNFSTEQNYFHNRIPGNILNSVLSITKNETSKREE